MLRKHHVPLFFEEVGFRGAWGRSFPTWAQGVPVILFFSSVPPMVAQEKKNMGQPPHTPSRGPASRNPIGKASHQKTASLVKDTLAGGRLSPGTPCGNSYGYFSLCKEGSDNSRSEVVAQHELERHRAMVAQESPVPALYAIVHE